MNPLDAYHNLSEDLQAYGTTDLTGSGEELEMILRKAADVQEWWKSLSPTQRTGRKIRRTQPGR